MNPKTLQYLMGHSDIVVTFNVYTRIGLDDATEELRKLEEMENARRELEKGQEKPVVSQKCLRQFKKYQMQPKSEMVWACL